LLVMAILATLAVLAAPQLGDAARGQRVSEAGRALVTLSRSARARGVATGKAHALAIDFEARTLRVLPGRDPLARTPAVGKGANGEDVYAGADLDAAAGDERYAELTLPEGAILLRAARIAADDGAW